MGSPLSPAVMNLFMEIFEKRASESVVLRLKLWVRYVDDTIVLYCGHMKRTNWRLSISISTHSSRRSSLQWRRRVKEKSHFWMSRLRRRKERSIQEEDPHGLLYQLLLTLPSMSQVRSHCLLEKQGTERL